MPKMRDGGGIGGRVFAGAHQTMFILLANLDAIPTYGLGRLK